MPGRAYNTDPGFENTRGAVPGTWYTEWVMQETPEQARYTTALQIFFIDQEHESLPRPLRLCTGAAAFASAVDDGPLLAISRI